MPLIVLTVVLQHPPIKQAPSSRHMETYETKSSSATQEDGCNGKDMKMQQLKFMDTQVEAYSKYVV